MKIAFLFPGQGSQFVGMGKDFYENYSEAKEIFHRAEEILQEPIANIIFEGPEPELVKTKNSQLGIFIVSAAILAVIKNNFPWITPYVCAGLSLGEYTALYAAGKISFEDALLVIQKRSHFMNASCEEKPGFMAAVLGLDSEKIEKVCQSLPSVWVANYNAPGQIVIAGDKKSSEIACEKLKTAGAKRVLPLQVHGAFHSGLMESAEKRLYPILEKLSISDSAIQVVMNSIGDFSPQEKIKENLQKQITSSVRWEQSIRAIQREGVEFFIEIGCGNTLSGLNKKIGAGPCLSISSVSSLDMLQSFLCKESLV